MKLTIDYNMVTVVGGTAASPAAVRVGRAMLPHAEGVPASRVCLAASLSVITNGTDGLTVYCLLLKLM